MPTEPSAATPRPRYPTPWRVERWDHRDVIRDAEGSMVYGVKGLSARIVEAVNSYDASRALIEQMRDTFIFIEKQFEGGLEGHENCRCQLCEGVPLEARRMVAAADKFLEGQ